MDTFKNFAIAQVVTPPSPPTTGTSLTLTPGATMYLPPVPFTIAVFDGSAYATPTNAELVRVTAIVGDTLTGLVRNYEGSTARTIVAGDWVAQTLTAQFVADVTNSANQSAGTLPDARLSANVPFKNAANIFTQSQEVRGPGLVVKFTDPSLPLTATVWMGLDGDSLVFTTFDYTTGAVVGQVSISHLGVLYAAAGLGATPLNASQLLSGTVPDARQSSNVALKNIDNHFVAQTLKSDTIIDDTNSLLRFNNPSAPSNARCWRFINYGDGLLRIEALTDSFAALQSGCYFTRAGDFAAGGALLERGRSTPMGQWVDVPFSASNFSASSGGTWTVGSAAVIVNRYTLIGKTCLWNLYISWFSGANVASGTPASFQIALPAGLASAATTDLPVGYAILNGVFADVHASIGSGLVSLQHPNGSVFSPNVGAAFGVVTMLMFEIA